MFAFFAEGMASVSQCGTKGLRKNADSKVETNYLNNEVEDSANKNMNARKSATTSRSFNMQQTTRTKFRRLTTLIFGSSLDPSNLLSSDTKPNDNQTENNTTIDNCTSSQYKGKVIGRQKAKHVIKSSFRSQMRKLISSSYLNSKEPIEERSKCYTKHKMIDIIFIKYRRS